MIIIRHRRQLRRSFLVENAEQIQINPPGVAETEKAPLGKLREMAIVATDITHSDHKAKKNIIDGAVYNLRKHWAARFAP